MGKACYVALPSVALELLLYIFILTSTGTAYFLDGEEINTLAWHLLYHPYEYISVDD